MAEETVLMLDSTFYQSASAASASTCSTRHRQMEALLLSGIHNHFIAANLEDCIDRFIFVNEFDLVDIDLRGIWARHLLRILPTFYDGDE